MSRRFPNVLDCLTKLKAERPECASEVDIALRMIFGKRPGIEAKYDALLLKLDREHVRLVDLRDELKARMETTPLFHERKMLRSRVFQVNKMITNMQWMLARNKDLINAVKPDAQPVTDDESLIGALKGLIQECEYSASSGVPFNFPDGKGHWTQLGIAKAVVERNGEES